MKATIGLTITYLLAVTGGALAQNAGGNIGGHAGWAKTRDADEGNFLVGAHAELRPIPWLGVQGSVDYRLADEFDFPGDGSLKVRSVPVTVTGRVYAIATESLSVFAAAGTGWYYLIYDYSDDLEDLGLDDDNESTFGWHVGGGVVIPVADMVAIYGEGRAIFVDPDQDVDDDLADDLENWDYDSTYFAAGVSFQF